MCAHQLTSGAAVINLLAEDGGDAGHWRVIWEKAPLFPQHPLSSSPRAAGSPRALAHVAEALAEGESSRCHYSLCYSRGMSVLSPGCEGTGQSGGRPAMPVTRPLASAGIALTL